MQEQVFTEQALLPAQLSISYKLKTTVKGKDKMWESKQSQRQNSQRKQRGDTSLGLLYFYFSHSLQFVATGPYLTTVCTMV